MAKYRHVQTVFWKDPKVAEEMTPEDKYFFLYLLTNPETTQIGIYPILKRQIAIDLSYSIDAVETLIERFIHHHELIRYNEETREIAIKNWGKYNLNRGGKPMIDCINAELEKVKDKNLITYVAEQIKHTAIKELYDTWTSSRQKEKEKGKEYRKNSVVRDLFNHYVSKKIITHRKMTSAMKTAMNARLKDYTFEELKKAIDNYAAVYFSYVHWFTHKYPLADFMRDKDVLKFLDEADPLVNFATKEPIQTRNRSIRKEDFDLS